ncbi:hypothetical protein D1013_09540 [Euzebyella marina]|uniref:BRCT domain-containing protein n=1 Tax=Euzebyella marina TaxID=1761453 RepID=A0A3G2L5R7_9FLAO|nr:hypothetical protein [Euzebyella marina]AYN67590.1 hypothetical protein D1013_09540 [Euzebyella marina]
MVTGTFTGYHHYTELAKVLAERGAEIQDHVRADTDLIVVGFFPDKEELKMASQYDNLVVEQDILFQPLKSDYM